MAKVAVAGHASVTVEVIAQLELCHSHVVAEVRAAQARLEGVVGHSREQHFGNVVAEPRLGRAEPRRGPVDETNLKF